MNRTPAAASRTRKPDSCSAGMRHAASSRIPGGSVEDSGRETRLDTIDDQRSTIETNPHAERTQQPACPRARAGSLLGDPGDREAAAAQQRDDAAIADQVIGTDRDEHVALREQRLELGIHFALRWNTIRSSMRSISSLV